MRLLLRLRRLIKIVIINEEFIDVIHQIATRFSLMFRFFLGVILKIIITFILIFLAKLVLFGFRPPSSIRDQWEWFLNHAALGVKFFERKSEEEVGALAPF